MTKELNIHFLEDRIKIASHLCVLIYIPPFYSPITTRNKYTFINTLGPPAMIKILYMKVYTRPVFTNLISYSNSSLPSLSSVVLF